MTGAVDRRSNNCGWLAGLALTVLIAASRAAAGAATPPSLETNPRNTAQPAYLRGPVKEMKHVSPAWVVQIETETPLNVGELWTVVVLYNSTHADLTFTDLVYASDFTLDETAKDRRKVGREATYDVSYTPLADGRVALDPPFVLRANSQAALRLHFKPDTAYDFSGLAAALEVWLVQSDSNFLWVGRQPVEPNNSTYRGKDDCTDARAFRRRAKPEARDEAEMWVQRKCPAAGLKPSRNPKAARPN
jgi:hypothetical protein